MYLSEMERERRYRDHACVSLLGPGWRKDREGETICGVCHEWFYWRDGHCYSRKTRKKFRLPDVIHATLEEEEEIRRVNGKSSRCEDEPWSKWVPLFY